MHTLAFLVRPEPGSTAAVRFCLTGDSLIVAAANAREAPARLVAIGDIGSTDAYHVGDEAMMAGLLEGVAACGVDAEWTLMSVQPERSSEQFGVRAVPSLTFRDCAGAAERERRLAELDTILAEPPARWPLIAPPRWREGLAAIAGSDGVVIAGGGNLCRTWPEHVFERAAGVRAARRAARPVAITGQTIGPAFDERTRELVAETLAGCVFVGAREEHSCRLAVELGVQPERLVLQFDDAIGLEEVEPHRSAEIVGDGEFIAVTLNQLGDLSDPAGIVPKFAAQLAELGRSTGRRRGARAARRRSRWRSGSRRRHGHRRDRGGGRLGAAAPGSASLAGGGRVVLPSCAARGEHALSPGGVGHGDGHASLVPVSGPLHAR